MWMVYRRGAFFSSTHAYCIFACNNAIYAPDVSLCQVSIGLNSLLTKELKSSRISPQSSELGCLLIIFFLYCLSIVLNKTHRQHLAVLHSFSGDQWHKRGGGLSPLHLCLLPFTEEQQPGQASPLFNFWSLFPTRRGPPFSSRLWYTYAKLGVDLEKKWRMRRLQRRKRQTYSWNCLSGASVTQKSILVLVVPNNY